MERMFVALSIATIVAAISFAGGIWWEDTYRPVFNYQGRIQGTTIIPDGDSYAFKVVCDGPNGECSHWHAVKR